MRELLMNLLTAVITATIPVLATALFRWLLQACRQLQYRAGTELEKRYTEELAEAVRTAVQATQQTYVDSLKTSGQFDQAAQKEALRRAIQACLGSLSQSCLDFMEELHGDLQAYLTPQIEAEVLEQKRY